VRAVRCVCGLAREEVDLDELADRVVDVGELTMQPEHISLLLRDEEKEGQFRPPAHVATL
jgi:hypothetical protein